MILRWIASDSWGIKQSVITGYETMASGAVTISPDLKVVPGLKILFHLKAYVVKNPRYITGLLENSLTKLRILISEAGSD